MIETPHDRMSRRVFVGGAIAGGATLLAGAAPPGLLGEPKRRQRVIPCGGRG